MNIANAQNLWGNDIPWLAGLREKGVIALNKQGWPSAKTEAWKYSYFAEKLLDKFAMDDEVCKCQHEHCHSHNLDFAVYSVNVCNGKVHIHSDDFPSGIVIKSLTEAIYDNEIKKYLNKSFDMEKFPFAAMNTAFIEQGIVIVAQRGFKADKPIYIHYKHSKENIFCALRSIFVLEKNSEATIIEHSEFAMDKPYFDNIVNEIYLYENARLNHYKLQEKAIDSYAICLNSVCCRENSKYNYFCAQKECALSRQESQVLLQHKGAETEVNGVYKITECGVCDMTTNIKHLCEYTSSMQLVKGVVDGKGKGVFQGQIHIAPSAVQTQGHQLHKALLLSNDAAVDCKPELEIFADDVQCSHGATCGDLDEEQLFYMLSRGIPEDEARKLLIQAHLQEVIVKIKDDRIRSWFGDFMQQ